MEIGWDSIHISNIMLDQGYDRLYTLEKLKTSGYESGSKDMRHEFEIQHTLAL